MPPPRGSPSRGLAERVSFAREVPGGAVAAAGEVRRAFRDHAASLRRDAVVPAPVSHAPPFPLDAPVEVFDRHRHHAQRLLRVAGMAGLTQVVVPGGVVDGAPWGFSLIGPRGSDLSLIRLSAQLTG